MKLSATEMRRRYDAGATIREVADHAGCSNSHAHRVLAAAGPMRPRSVGRRQAGMNRIRAHRHTVCRFYIDGLTTTEIGLVFGCSHDAVAQFLRAEQVPVRPATPRTTADLERAAELLTALRRIDAATGKLRPRLTPSPANDTHALEATR